MQGTGAWAPLQQKIPSARAPVEQPRGQGSRSRQTPLRVQGMSWGAAPGWVAKFRPSSAPWPQPEHCHPWARPGGPGLSTLSDRLRQRFPTEACSFLVNWTKFLKSRQDRRPAQDRRTAHTAEGHPFKPASEPQGTGGCGMSMGQMLGPTRPSLAGPCSPGDPHTSWELQKGRPH